MIPNYESLRGVKVTTAFLETWILKPFLEELQAIAPVIVDYASHTASDSLKQEMTTGNVVLTEFPPTHNSLAAERTAAERIGKDIIKLAEERRLVILAIDGNTTRDRLARQGIFPKKRGIPFVATIEGRNFVDYDEVARRLAGALLELRTPTAPR